MNYYTNNSQQLIRQYDSLRSEDVHADWSCEIPSIPGRALDIGAGSGRDARWLTKLGWQVTAIEPCTELRELAQNNSPENITWLNDSLPKVVSIGNQPFDLILVSAVWMHLNQSEQKQAYQRLSNLLSDKGLLVITWRNQANDTNRHFENVDESLIQGARIITSYDKGGRDKVLWKCAIVMKVAK